MSIKLIKLLKTIKSFCHNQQNDNINTCDYDKGSAPQKIQESH